MRLILVVFGSLTTETSWAGWQHGGPATRMMTRASRLFVFQPLLTKLLDSGMTLLPSGAIDSFVRKKRLNNQLRTSCRKTQPTEKSWINSVTLIST